MKVKIFLIVVVLSFCHCKNKVETVLAYHYSFENSNEGWSFGYSDYPANLTLNDSLDLYKMFYGYTNLPANILPLQKGLRLRGKNRSDDLFMYVKKNITGLTPNANYTVSFDIDMASNAPTNAAGVGGAPGEGVTLKVGAITFEPKNLRNILNHYELNIDKGYQTKGGKDMVVAGNIGVSDTTKSFTLIKRMAQLPTMVKTDTNGQVWVIVGTDSGYEGLTELYYANISIKLKKL